MALTEGRVIISDKETDIDETTKAGDASLPEKRVLVRIDTPGSESYSHCSKIPVTLCHVQTLR